MPEFDLEALQTSKAAGAKALALNMAALGGQTLAEVRNLVEKAFKSPDLSRVQITDHSFYVSEQGGSRGFRTDGSNHSTTNLGSQKNSDSSPVDPAIPTSRSVEGLKLANRNPREQLTAQADPERDLSLESRESQYQSNKVEAKPQPIEMGRSFDITVVKEGLQLAVLKNLEARREAGKEAKANMESPSSASTFFVKTSLKEQGIALVTPNEASNNIVRFRGPNPQLDLATQPGTAGSISLVKDTLAEGQQELIPA